MNADGVYIYREDDTDVDVVASAVDSSPDAPSSGLEMTHPHRRGPWQGRVGAQKLDEAVVDRDLFGDRALFDSRVHDLPATPDVPEPVPAVAAVTGPVPDRRGRACCPSWRILYRSSSEDFELGSLPSSLAIPKDGAESHLGSTWRQAGSEES
ncbi:MAG: hypothetical protein M1826_006439 [Phylliscum demangeonii]|nr:MAG: hypothetical protein M1826_006439 [Phylliscum demangeonii]